ncbi:MAG TPA: thioredoxin domain-containing protein [Rubrobacteraceae bacterium]|nr:thioredoxin domain-containing protein [Rubrobacteraceae bacterium]
MQKGNVRLVIVLAAVAVAVAGLMVVLSQLEGGGSQETFADIPQDYTTLGREDAPVEIQLYEDFQCPACAQFARETLPELVEARVEPGEARLVSETMAFLGPDSVSTARAALAAGEQDRYWQYAYLLFENQGAENSGYATDEFLTNLAEETEGLDVEEWRAARDDASVDKELEAVQKRADAAGVQATPTIVVSGPGGEEMLRGAVPIEEVERAIEEVQRS